MLIVVRANELCPVSYSLARAVMIFQRRNRKKAKIGAREKIPTCFSDPQLCRFLLIDLLIIIHYRL